MAHALLYFLSFLYPYHFFPIKYLSLFFKRLGLLPQRDLTHMAIGGRSEASGLVSGALIVRLT